MPHLDVAHFLGLLAAMLAAAMLAGALSRWAGQPAVLGELAAGVLLGTSVVGLVDPTNETVYLLAQTGVVLLLFETGLATDLRELLRAGGAAAAVAVVGVGSSFALGYAACRLLGVGGLAATVAGASLTATSVGITARVLSDLGRLREPEGRVILGAAVLDDVLGLAILSVVAGLTRGQEMSAVAVAETAGMAFGFLAAALLLGRLLVPPLFRLAGHVARPGTAAGLAVLLAFGLAWLAARAGSAAIIGAFAAGLLLRAAPQAREIERGVAHLGRFFVPLFFVSVGAAVDVRLLNPLDPANGRTLLVGGVLVVAAVVAKLLAGYAPVWFRGRKAVIGVGMVPRGEVSLLVAQLGLGSGVIDRGLFSAVTLMVMATTLVSPPWLKLLLGRKHPEQRPPERRGFEELVT
ncbi:MAG TPA: cation:proton antiporter [Gemmataceae bacterium]|jgi:Kef-type K+ transport system membrane component KefB|nr:cation:proton antiporter [Gemmataceae bacterium]